VRGLSPRQQELLGHLQTHIAEKGYPPTIRELCVLMGVRSTNAISEQLRAIEGKGYLETDPIRSRAIRLTAPPGAVSVAGLDQEIARLEREVARSRRRIGKLMTQRLRLVGDELRRAS
jgi:repressor LexA